MNVVEKIILSRLVGVYYLTFYRFKDDELPKWRRLALREKTRGLITMDRITIGFPAK